MAELVTRTFISTKITFNVIETDNASVWLGEPQTMVVTGKVDEETALKAVKKSQGKNKMYIINNLEYLEESMLVAYQILYQSVKKQKNNK